MPDITATLQDAYRELCIHAHAAGLRVRGRLAEQRGQTAAEYMGILLVVAVIIGALIAADVDGKIASAGNTMVGKIAGGNDTRSPPGPPGACGTAPPPAPPGPSAQVPGLPLL